MLINRLQDCAFGKCEMTPSQVRAALIVVNKNVPNLKAVKVEYGAAPSYADTILQS